MKNNNTNTREEDIQSLCSAVLNMSIESTGDSGMGGQCPLCSRPCRWNDEMSDVIHEPYCAYLIAKDLSTNH